MKRSTRSLFLIGIICIMLFMSACGKEMESKESERQLIIVASAEGNVPKEFANSVPAQKCGLYTGYEYRKLLDDKAYKLSPLNPLQELKYKYSDCTMKDGTSNEIGDFYCIYDVYTSEEEEVMYLHDTDIISFYHKDFNPDENYPLMEENEVRKIAEDFLKSIIPGETLETFTYERMTMDAIGRYSIFYTKYVEGYATDETISVWVDRCGTISGYNGLNLKKYETLNAVIEREQLDSAYEFLVSTISAMGLLELEYYEPTIITNTSGELYLEVSFTYVDEEGIGYGETALVKIE